MYKLISAFATQKFCSFWKPISLRILHSKSQKFQQFKVSRSSLNVCSQFVSSVSPQWVSKDSPVISSVVFFSLSSPQWSAASAQIPCGEFFHHCSPLVRATAAAGWPYSRLLSVLPEGGWSRKPTESTNPPWGQILWIMRFLGKHFVLRVTLMYIIYE